MNKQIRLAGVVYESFVNGPGIRRVYFCQGCSLNCPECFNKHTHSKSKGELVDMDELIEDAINNPLVKGITFSGGEPFEQADKFVYMAKEFKKNNLNIWCYSGYTFEELSEKLIHDNNIKELLENIDVLVDGRFEIDKKNENLKFRGSSNQRIINMPETIKNKEIVLMAQYM